MAHSVGKTISTLRKEKGWTQADLAERIGLTDKAVSKWESEGGLPDTTIFPTLAEIFGVSIDYLMTGPKESSRSMNNTPIHNKNVFSEEEEIQKKVAETIHNGIIDIDELLATKDFQLIKKAILEHPIHPFELDYAQIKELYEALENKNWRKLFAYAVDNVDITGEAGRRNISIAIINADSDAIKKHLDNIGKFFIARWNASFKQYHSSSVKSYASPNTIKLRYDSDTEIYSLEGISEYLNQYRQQVIEDASLKWDKEKIIEDLTKEYFYNELSKKNIEMVIIKLCVRLEAILKSDYHYEGDLAKIINQYCDNHGKEYDDWGYLGEYDFVKHLHKLRKQRNSIVHSEKNDEEMTEEEIKFCIDYICSLG